VQAFASFLTPDKKSWKMCDVRLLETGVASRTPNIKPNRFEIWRQET
jgi:hypothetical protein